ncbi:hypothetical protein PFISCL1PPCAC_24767, partial [Pristionchus fissidentatus]
CNFLIYHSSYSSFKFSCPSLTSSIDRVATHEWMISQCRCRGRDSTRKDFNRHLTGGLIEEVVAEFDQDITDMVEEPLLNSR